MWGNSDNSNNGSAINTLVANSMASGRGDSANRDMVGDMTGGAMGTMIGNDQGLMSNALSEYNQNNMSEAQKNLTMLDIARGDSPANYGPSMYDTNSVNLTSPALSSPSLSTPNMSSPHDKLSSSYTPSSHAPINASSPYDNLGTPQGGSLYDPMAGPVMYGATPNVGNKPQAPSLGEKYKNNSGGGTRIVYVEKPAPKVSTTPDNSNAQNASQNTQESGATGKGRNTANAKTQEEELEEYRKLHKDVKVGSEQPSSNRTLRQIEIPKTRAQFDAIQAPLSKKQTLDNKLSRLTEDELIFVVQKAKTDLESEDKDTRIIASVKLSILEKEVAKRHNIK